MMSIILSLISTQWIFFGHKMAVFAKNCGPRESEFAFPKNFGNDVGIRLNHALLRDCDDISKWQNRISSSSTFPPWLTTGKADALELHLSTTMLKALLAIIDASSQMKFPCAVLPFRKRIATIPVHATVPSGPSMKKTLLKGSVFFTAVRIDESELGKPTYKGCMVGPTIKFFSQYVFSNALSNTTSSAIDRSENFDINQHETTTEENIFAIVLFEQIKAKMNSTLEIDDEISLVYDLSLGDEDEEMESAASQYSSSSSSSQQTSSSSQESEGGPVAKKLAIDLRISQETINKIVQYAANHSIGSTAKYFKRSKSDIQSLLECVAKGGSTPAKQTAIRDFVKAKFEEARASGSIIHYWHLQAWGREEAREVGYDSFKASRWWIDNFKMKNRIVSRKITRIVSHRELASEQQIIETARSFVTDFNDVKRYASSGWNSRRKSSERLSSNMPNNCEAFAGLANIKMYAKVSRDGKAICESSDKQSVHSKSSVINPLARAASVNKFVTKVAAKRIFLVAVVIRFAIS
uniref:HTH CENPB-type domain-containing protein n=1 Tax=Tetranychus urticae TaxID=32264 RepID=T1L054_TETUR